MPSSLGARSGQKDDADVRRERRAAQIAEYVAQVIADWPPLTPEQRDRIAALLSPEIRYRADRGEAA